MKVWRYTKKQKHRLHNKYQHTQTYNKNWTNEILKIGCKEKNRNISEVYNILYYIHIYICISLKQIIIVIKWKHRQIEKYIKKRVKWMKFVFQHNFFYNACKLLVHLTFNNPSSCSHSNVNLICCTTETEERSPVTSPTEWRRHGGPVTQLVLSPPARWPHLASNQWEEQDPQRPPISCMVVRPPAQNLGGCTAHSRGADRCC